ncbi:MAG TPA: DUF2480 family protein [Saprospiraceae bacterium]|nr:DUF2480 family protein [Saprospiraceae bacterium]HRO08097.1 DUF2480 family protein [Saprospiraceae bacterium]HRP41316.1 DUF2480 family protein [Saprospiraceae bacterium]
MEEEKTLVNRVAASGLITLNLEDYFPTSEIATFDIKDYLFHGLILREKDFRDALKQLDWSVYKDKIVLVNCSTDAVIPLWAYMLIENYLMHIATDTYQGTEEEYLRMFYRETLENTDFTQYQNQRIVIKGCGNKPVPSYAYTKITALLIPLVQSLMFGEPCSTVPIFKKAKSQ